VSVDCSVPVFVSVPDAVLHPLALCEDVDESPVRLVIAAWIGKSGVGTSHLRTLASDFEAVFLLPVYFALVEKMIVFIFSISVMIS
jgi:hypothetical protein